jgi:very-short-patch-repair endonuclease
VSILAHWYDGYMLAKQMQPEKLELARKMRKRPTDAEALLWAKLRGRRHDGNRWHRQRPIAGYIVDFYCPARKLVIEVDGSIHDESVAYDSFRDSVLMRAGLMVLRVSNAAVLAGWLP